MSNIIPSRGLEVEARPYTGHMIMVSLLGDSSKCNATYLNSEIFLFPLMANYA